MCVLPLGTGNDLSRILRWGKGYAGEDLYEYVKQVEESTSVLPFDRFVIGYTDKLTVSSWFVKYTPLSEEEIEKLIEERKNGGNDSDSEEDGSEVKSGSGKKKGLVRSASVRSDRSLKSSSSKVMRNRERSNEFRQRLRKILFPNPTEECLMEVIKRKAIKMITRPPAVAMMGVKERIKIKRKAMKKAILIVRS